MSEVRIVTPTLATWEEAQNVVRNANGRLLEPKEVSTWARKTTIGIDLWVNGIIETGVAPIFGAAGQLIKRKQPEKKCLLVYMVDASKAQPQNHGHRPAVVPNLVTRAQASSFIHYWEGSFFTEAQVMDWSDQIPIGLDVWVAGSSGDSEVSRYFSAQHQDLKGKHPDELCLLAFMADMKKVNAVLLRQRDTEQRQENLRRMGRIKSDRSRDKGF